VVGHVNGNHKPAFRKLAREVGDKIFIAKTIDRDYHYPGLRAAQDRFPTQRSTATPRSRLHSSPCGADNALEHTAGGASYVTYDVSQQDS